MAWGVRLLAVAYALIILVVLVNASRVIRMGGIFIMSDFIGAGALQVIGAWALARKSNHRSEPRTRIVRFLLRVSSFGMLIAWLGQVAPSTPSAHRIINIAMILGYLTPAMALLRLRAVARMIADSRLAERCMLVGYGALVTVLLYGALTAWGMTRRLFTPTLFVIERSIDFALLFFMILAAIVLAHCVIDFGRAAKLATRAWRADAPNGTSG